jgi:hypothetical protein
LRQFTPEQFAQTVDRLFGEIPIRRQLAADNRYELTRNFAIQLYDMAARYG